MEKANYTLWDLVEDISLSQAAYLWCGYEPPADEYSEKQSSFYSMPPKLKPKPLPQMVKVLLFQLINAVKSGELKLKKKSSIENGYGASAYKWMWKDGVMRKICRHEKLDYINPQTVGGFNKVRTKKDYLRDYAESIGQRPQFLYPDSQKTDLSDNPIDEIIINVMLGVEKIFEAVKKLGFSERRDPMPFDEKKVLYRKSALKELSKIQNHYPSIKEEFLNSEMFEFNVRQQRRDFMGKLLRKILINKGIKKTGSYSEVYKRYLMLQDRPSLRISK